MRVTSFRGDDTSPFDGIPDYWRTNYFGPQSANSPSAGDDSDGDRLSNLREYMVGTNPKDPSSAQRITFISPGSLRFQAKAYEPYEVLGSTDLTTWTRVAAVMPTNISYEARIALPQTNIIAVVSNLPTSGQRMYFRILKVP